MRGYLVATAMAFAGAVLSAQAKEPTPSGWSQYKGKGYILCDGLLKELRRYKYPEPLKNPNSCSWAVVANYPDLLEPPWEDLDVKQYEELLFQIERLNAIGPKNYFAGIKDKTDQGYAPRPEGSSREQVKNFIDSGGSLQLWRMPLLDRYSRLKKNSETAGSLIILHIKTPIPDTDEGLRLCPDLPTVKWQGRIALVNDSLTGPDPRPYTDAADGLKYLNGSLLRLFKGVLHRFTESGLSIEIYRDDIPATDWAGDFCRLEYRHPNSGRK